MHLKFQIVYEFVCEFEDETSKVYCLFVTLPLSSTVRVTFVVSAN